MIIQSKLLYFLTISLILYRFVNLTAQATLVRDKYNYCRHVVERRGRRGREAGLGLPSLTYFPNKFICLFAYKNNEFLSKSWSHFFPEHVKTESEQ